MLQDRSFLESADKKQIKLTLENCLAELDKRYGQKTSSIFPGHAEWDKLNTLCTKFASLLGKTKTDYGAWDSSIRLIGGKYNKLPLRDFIEKIISRLGDLPIPPCTSIYNAIQQLKEPNKEPDVQAQLQAIYEVIRSRSWLFNVDSKPWVEWLRVIRRHRIAIDKILLELAKNESIDQKTAAFLLFRQMHHEQLMWITQYHQATKSTVDWIQSLNNQTYYSKLTKVFHGDAANPEQIRRSLAKIKNSERQRSYRQNHPLKKGT